VTAGVKGTGTPASSFPTAAHHARHNEVGKRTPIFTPVWEPLNFSARFQ